MGYTAGQAAWNIFWVVAAWGAGLGGYFYFRSGSEDRSGCAASGALCE